jgi:hypothetical protein
LQFSDHGNLCHDLDFEAEAAILEQLNVKLNAFGEYLKANTHACENLAARAHQWEQIWV